MYTCYERSSVCFICLDDVQDASEIKHARWFTRGWLLQELIAPETAIFFSKDWKQILGTRGELCKELVEITGIPTDWLLPEKTIVVKGAKKGLWNEEDEVDEADGQRTVHVANHAPDEEKRKWAACRQTTREEDSVYCLMGLFQAFIPILYGEGKVRAMRRLKAQLGSDKQTYFLAKAQIVLLLPLALLTLTA
jgi:hypothetical protein